MRWGHAVVIPVALMVAGASPVFAQTEQSVIARAVERRICYEVFWRHDRDFRLGEGSYLNYISIGNHAYAWSRGLAKGSLYNGPDTKLFEINAYGGSSFVARYFTNFGMDQASDFRFFKRMVREIPTDMKQMDFELPRDCTPRFDPPTPWKEQAVAKIALMIQKESRQMAWTGDPANMEIVIGNFNSDYPRTEVYIPNAKKLVIVHLRDEDHPQKAFPSPDSFTLEQLSPARWSESSIQEEGDKVTKYGIRRTIHWGN